MSFLNAFFLLSEMISLLEPYGVDSHMSWAKGLVENSSFEVKLESLPGEAWRSRMEVGALSLYDFVSSSDEIVVLSEMLSLPLLKSLLLQKGLQPKTLIYFHENQLNYPWESKSESNKALHRAFAVQNLTSALIADSVVFNSSYHQKSFFETAESLALKIPSIREIPLGLIKEKSSILSPGFDGERLKVFQREGEELKKQLAPETQIIIWNHRWDYDKNPVQFFGILDDLKKKSLPFKLVVCGHNTQGDPKVFEEAQERFKDEILHWGYLERFEDYAKWLWASDISLVTSNQEFFGISAAEAAYCRCYPLWPNRLSYPELLPEELHASHLWEARSEALERLSVLLGSCPGSLGFEPIKEHLERFSWPQLGEDYDCLFKSILLSQRS